MVFLTIVIWLVLILAYFLPTIVAGIKHRKNLAAITLLNVLTGWTVVGWVIALVWAVME